MTTTNLLYVSQAGRSIGPATLPARSAATYARDTARASGKDALIYATAAGGEPLARVDKDGNLSTAATAEEIDRMTPEAFRASVRDADGRIFVPAGDGSPDAVKALAKSLEVPAPTPAQANASSIGAWFLSQI